jgi:hypothetical protein
LEDLAGVRRCGVTAVFARVSSVLETVLGILNSGFNCYEREPASREDEVDIVKTAVQ